MNFFSIILGLILVCSGARAASECKSERTRSYAEQLARLDPKIDLDLIDIEMFPKGSFVAGYEYKVEPAYTNGLYAREDRWQISTEAIPEKLKDLKNGLSVNFSGGLKHHVEASFIRFEKDPCLAMKLLPYPPQHLPLSSRRVLGERFKIGEYFLFRGSAGILLSAEILSLFSSGLWGVGLSGQYLMEAFYQFHLVRIDEKHVRLKIVAHNGKTLNGSLGFGWDGDFNVFKVSGLDNQLEKFVNLKPLKLKGEQKYSSVFMVDYVLDLSDEKVASAFDQVIKKIKYFKEIAILSPFKSDKDISSYMVLDLAPLEDIFKQDHEENKIERIRRNLSTTSNQSAQKFGLELGNKVLGIKWMKEKATSKMGVRRDDNILDMYLLKTWEDTWQGRFLYSWSKNTEESGVRALFQDKNTQDEKLIPINIVNYLYKKKNRFSHKNLLAVQKVLSKALPLEIYRVIPWTNWGQVPKKRYTNFGLRYDLIMSPEGITQAPQLSEDEIKVLFRDHILSKGLTVKDYFSDQRRGPRARSVSAEDIFEKNLNKFSQLLSETLDRSRTAEERMSSLAGLIKNKLFEASGFSFIMALRPDQMKSLFHVNLNISANEAQIDFSFGDSELSVLYKKLLTVKAALDDDALDLIREAESISSLPAK